MPALTFVPAVLLLALDQFLGWRYGATGIIGLSLLTIGIKVKSPSVTSVGAVVLALLVARPAL
ncbi:hypothetical protein [Streptomyces sp. CRN 30]|uniref:hypothetical protein n=1 Tax=Streptomyces sp. CRN 30 TaxID=3075613 RepID=UPI002A808F69|nr:hypothetical protein [Streptomyces sp. CRN 30]